MVYFSININTRRKSYDALFAEQNDLAEIKEIEEQIKQIKNIETKHSEQSGYTG